MSDSKGLHIGLVLDGNRRWAKFKALASWKGHEAGADNLKVLLKSLDGGEISELTLYAFSMQNFNRSEDEKDKLFKIMADHLKSIKDDPELRKKSVRVNFIGRRHLLPEYLNSVMSTLEDSTKENTGYQLNFCVAYGGREEMTDAVKRIVSEGISAESITEEVISEHLYLNSSPDFIVRTGGDNRTSNFLPWQSIYSEWFFLDKNWPDFTIDDLGDCIRKFKNRDRRFGK